MQAATLRRPALADHQRMLRLADEQVLFNDFEREERIREYRLKLGMADWNYEHTDNHEAWKAGRDEFTKLYELQAEVDPDGVIWHSVAPAGFTVPQPRIVRRAAS